MTPFRNWLDRVLTRGESVQETAPALPPDERPSVEALLRTAFDAHALDVAGPPLAFDPAAAHAAAGLLARACWLLVGTGEADSVSLALNTPHSTAAHLSADVTLRFLPAVHRRARLRDPDGALVAGIERVLRAWPLSGALADLDGSPTTPPDFAGHPGLQILYAERLAGSGRAGWVPSAEPARGWAERVHAELGRPLPARPPEGPRE